MKKLLVLGLVLFVAFGAVFAEGQGETATEEVTITMWTQEGESEGAFQFILDELDAYMAANPNVTVELVQKGNEALREDFQTASLAGTAPTTGRSSRTAPYGSRCAIA